MADRKIPAMDAEWIDNQLPADTVGYGEMASAPGWTAIAPNVAVAPADPADLKELPYPELIRRKDSLAAEIESIAIEGGVFDGRMPPRIKDLEAIQDALRRKREESAGKGTRHKRKGEVPGETETTA